MFRNRLVKAAFFALATGAAFASTIVVPGIDANVTAAGGNDFPFNLADQFRTQMRYQQVYASSAFGGGPILMPTLKSAAKIVPPAKSAKASTFFMFSTSAL